MPGMFTRATTLLENIQRRVSASSGAQGANGTADDADNARQFMRVNEVKRLTTRIRTGVATLADAGEKGAWEAQLVLLESETATAVEAVLSAASPAPAETRRPERRNEQTTPTNNMSCNELSRNYECDDVHLPCCGARLRLRSTASHQPA